MQFSKDSWLAFSPPSFSKLDWVVEEDLAVARNSTVETSQWLPVVFGISVLIVFIAPAFSTILPLYVRILLPFLGFCATSTMLSRNAIYIDLREKNLVLTRRGLLWITNSTRKVCYAESIRFIVVSVSLGGEASTSLFVKRSSGIFSFPIHVYSVDQSFSNLQAIESLPFLICLSRLTDCPVEIAFPGPFRFVLFVLGIEQLRSDPNGDTAHCRVDHSDR